MEDVVVDVRVDVFRVDEEAVYVEDAGADGWEGGLVGGGGGGGGLGHDVRVLDLRWREFEVWKVVDVNTAHLTTLLCNYLDGILYEVDAYRTRDKRSYSPIYHEQKNKSTLIP